MQRVTEYELINHGIEHSQYFQGCRVASTLYRHVVTGIGNNPAEAIDDCLEQVATGEPSVDTEALEKRILADGGWEFFPETPALCDGCEPDCNCDGCELNYYVSIRYNVAD